MEGFTILKLYEKNCLTRKGKSCGELKSIQVKYIFTAFFLADDVNLKF